MKSQEIAYIIPGYLFSPEQKQYQKIAEYLQAKNIDPIPVPIAWKERTITESVASFLELDKQQHAIKKDILGFSFGAIIAMIASTSIPVDTLILCSLSPFFQEDLPLIPAKYTQDLTTKQIEEFEVMNNKAIIRNSTARKIILLYGTSEGVFVEKRAKDTFANISSEKQMIVIDGVKHKIEDEKYQRAIQEVIEKL